MTQWQPPVAATEHLPAPHPGRRRGLFGLRRRAEQHDLADPFGRADTQQVAPLSELADGALAGRIRAGEWPGRVLAFVNPKGGVHKTTATVLTASSIGLAIGHELPGEVIAWDNNELRGTLGLRARTARHARTIRHLLADLPDIERGGRLGDEALREILDNYVRPQDDGLFDVLAADENPRIARLLNEPTVLRVLGLLRRTYSVVCVDTGNNVESQNWRTAVRAADRLVVVTVAREDAAFTADWLLDLLEEDGLGRKVADAVTVVSAPGPGQDQGLGGEILSMFSRRTRAVVPVPYDRHLDLGSRIEYDSLTRATKTAWRHVAAATLDGLAT